MIEWTLRISDIVNLIFIVVILWEVILLRRNSRANVWQDSIDKILELDRLVIKNEELQPIWEEDFFEKNSELTPAQKRFILSYFSCLEQLYVNKSTIKGRFSNLLGNNFWEPWRNHIEHVMSLPAFKEVWKKDVERKDFVEEFQKEANKFIKENT